MSKSQKSKKMDANPPQPPTSPHGGVIQLPMLAGDPMTDAKARKQIHGPYLAGVVYARHLQKLDAKGDLLRDLTVETAVDHTADTLARMQPRDPIEEMLIQQALWTHSRIAWLTGLAANQNNLEALRFFNEACDRATNSYRRLMLTLAQYRQPPRGDSFTAIKQANIANQQVVMNHANEKSRNTTNEQGCSAIPAGAAPPAAALPPVLEGLAVPVGQHPARQAVDASHRPAQPGGQGAVQDERPETR